MEMICIFSGHQPMYVFLYMPVECLYDIWFTKNEINEANKCP